MLGQIKMYRLSLNYENNQQDALYRLIYYSKSARSFNSFETPAVNNLGEHYQIM